ncbi:MAG: hypothetical protein MH112_03135 [Phenylobacterium sp.]|uniref:hypothetical protein n=1 Tax=Phenylobacterium sp. TaxID=1871053 RepID=UPI0025EFB164|nr:hypothetical protein [Phenylobacterium sp.]MCG9915340.1 hypothetical protein [Phenylobacterium sp.]
MTVKPGPDDPSDQDPTRPLLGPRFWLLISFTVVCILAGLAVAWLGPVWFPAP